MKRRPKLPSIKREIKDFLLSEEGKISKKDIAKIGMSLAVLSVLFTPDTVSAGHSSNPNANHNSSLHDSPSGTGQGGHASGTTHGSHSSHGSHGSHGQW